LGQRLKNKEIIQRVKEERNILHTIKRRNAEWIGRRWLRNCRLKHVIGGKIEGRLNMTRRLGRRRKKLLDDVKEKRGYLKQKGGAVG
jgi:hypothetical protein